MKVLGSAVLTMEVFVMGFAMLLAKDIHEPATIIYGFGFMLVTIATVRLLKKRIGSLVQFFSSHSWPIAWLSRRWLS
jgi:hypothetical protein